MDISRQQNNSHGHEGQQAAEECMAKANDDDKHCGQNTKPNSRSQSNLLFEHDLDFHITLLV